MDTDSQYITTLIALHKQVTKLAINPLFKKRFVFFFCLKSKCPEIVIIRLENTKLCNILKLLAVDRRLKKTLHYAIWKLGPSIRDGSDHQYLVNLNPRGSACSIYV